MPDTSSLFNKRPRTPERIVDSILNQCPLGVADPVYAKGSFKEAKCTRRNGGGWVDGRSTMALQKGVRCGLSSPRRKQSNTNGSDRTNGRCRRAARHVPGAAVGVPEPQQRRRRLHFCSTRQETHGWKPEEPPSKSRALNHCSTCLGLAHRQEGGQESVRPRGRQAQLPPRPASMKTSALQGTPRLCRSRGCEHRGSHSTAPAHPVGTLPA